MATLKDHFNHYIQYGVSHNPFPKNGVTEETAIQVLELGLEHLEKRKNDTFFFDSYGINNLELWRELDELTLEAYDRLTIASKSLKDGEKLADALLWRELYVNSEKFLSRMRSQANWHIFYRFLMYAAIMCVFSYMNKEIAFYLLCGWFLSKFVEKVLDPFMKNTINDFSEMQKTAQLISRILTKFIGYQLQYSPNLYYQSACNPHGVMFSLP